MGLRHPVPPDCFVGDGTNQSHQTCKWVTSHVRMSRFIHTNKSRIWMSHGVYQQTLFRGRWYERVMSHLQTSHITPTNESHHAYKWVTNMNYKYELQMWITNMNESRRRYDWSSILSRTHRTNKWVTVHANCTPVSWDVVSPFHPLTGRDLFKKYFPPCIYIYI